jgi:hypothetical protein
MKKCDDAKVTNKQTKEKRSKSQFFPQIPNEATRSLFSHNRSSIPLLFSNATEDVFDGVGWVVKSVSRE